MNKKPLTLRQWNRKLRKNKKKPRIDRKPYSLYALELEDGYWYIGISIDVAARYNQHSTGKGAMWTKRHPPVAIAEVRPTPFKNQKVASVAEDLMTLEYAEKYGFNNVRGGRYCQQYPRWPKE